MTGIFRLMTRSLFILAAMLCLFGSSVFAKGAADSEHQAKADRVRQQQEQRVSTEERKAAATSLITLRQRIHDLAIQKYGFDPKEKAKKERRQKGASGNHGKSTKQKGTMGVVGTDFQPIPVGPFDAAGNPSLPDYNTTANWAYTPPLAKFVDTLPTLDCSPTGKNNLGQCLSVGVPDVDTYPGTDYYEISLEQWNEPMHSDLPDGTPTRGYVQTNAPGTPAAEHHFLGPVIVAQKDRPVRIKFTNNLPVGFDGNGRRNGDLFIPVDQSVMGAGKGPLTAAGAPCDNTVEGNTCASYTQNRATIHLHGGRTPWISDGTPHQWITPATETTPYPQGVSVANVPDMPIPQPGDGSMTFYYSNQQTARLMFYHDHAFGITRLNVLAGMAAGYVIRDQYEEDLVTRGVLPADEIPLIIQDRTFVDATPVTHPVTGATVPQIRVYDPLWNWGTGPIVNATTGEREPRTGDLWLPHVYVPAQNPFNPDNSGVNPFGRWLYGPWFYPPTVITHPPVANPYYDADCDSTNPWILADCAAPGQPPLIPATPSPSMGMEAFFDSMIVNGTAFPRLEVDPKAYRFRVLNAANDRGLNLSIYVADSTTGNLSPIVPGATYTPIGNPAVDYTVASTFSNQTEVKMTPAQPTAGWPELWPIDGRDGGVPDPGSLLPDGRYSNWGPSWIQIGTDAGFLPQPVVKDPQPITYVTDPTAFWVGVVKDTSLGIMPAERADVIVDFSKYAGKTLIVYNDAPTAWPALDFRYDYFTGTPDMRDSGGYGAGGVYNDVTGVFDGGHGILPGFAPNTRTVMQIVVKNTTQVPFDMTALQDEFTTAAPATILNPTSRPLFERAMEPIIVAQPAYDAAYGKSFPTNFPWGGVRYALTERTLKFVTIDGQPVEIKLQPKGIHDEMGASFDPEYGRMSGNLAIELDPPTTNNANLNLYGFSDVPTEIVANSTSSFIEVLPNGVDASQVGILNDGTQIWNVSHNGVDTHPIHFHIFDVQLISRLGWDGQIALPDANELGWKDTVRISPLMDTIVAVRPVAPLLPFGIPNSMRPLNPSIPINSPMGFSNVDPVTGQAYLPPSPWAGGVTNVLYDFGWEYVWHCHILSHEEMDMMRPIILQVDTMLADPFTLTVTPNGGAADLSWTDPTTVDITTGVWGNALTNEIGYYVWRSDLGTGIYHKVGSALANHTTFSETINNAADKYVVEAYTATGSTYSEPLSTVTLNIAEVAPYTAPQDFTLTTVVGEPLAQSTTLTVNYYEGTDQTGYTLLGPGTGGTYAFSWPGVQAGAYNIVAVVTAVVPDPTLTDPLNTAVLYAASNSVPVTVGGALTASFTALGTTSGTTDIGICDTTTLTGSGATTYSWLVNGVTYAGSPVVLPALPAGTYPVVMTATSGGVVEVVNGSFIVVAHKPTGVSANTTGVEYVSDPLTSSPGLPTGYIKLSGTGTIVDQCVLGAPTATNTLSYAWDLGSNGSYEFFTNDRSLKNSTAFQILGAGVSSVTLKVTDSNGSFETATTPLTVIDPTVVAPASITVQASSTDGSLTVSWEPSLTAGATYTVQESTDPTFATAVTTLTNVVSPLAITGKANGTYYYRVKAVVMYMLDSSWTVGANGCFVQLTLDAITSPLTGSTFTGTSQAFTWGATGADLYQLYVGTTQGANDLGRWPATASAATSVTVYGLPNDGRQIYVRFYSKFGLNWYFFDYTYNAWTLPSSVTMVAPVNNTSLVGTSQPFSWNSGADVYQLYVGKTLGGQELGRWPASPTAATNVTVNGLPSDGSPVYVRLWSRIGTTWVYIDYNYSAWSAPSAFMLTPTSPSTLPGSSQTFTWDGNGGDLFQIYVGTTPGASNLGRWPVSATTATSAFVPALPVDGSQVYVRLYSKYGTEWRYIDYVYTAVTQ